MLNPFACRIFSDVAGDIAIVVDGESFLLHKVRSLSSSYNLQIEAILFVMHWYLLYILLELGLVSWQAI